MDPTANHRSTAHQSRLDLAQSQIALLAVETEI